MLPYSQEVLNALLARYNAELWPLQVAVYLAVLLALYLAARPRRGSDRLIAGILAAAWLWCGGVYFLRYLAPLDFAAPGFAALFALQGLLLLWSGVLRGGLVFRVRRTLAGWAGLAVLALALLAPPILSLARVGDLTQTHALGITPLSAMLLTLGFLLLSGRAPLYLLPLPLAWAAFEGFRGWYFESPERMTATAIVVIAVAVLIGRRWRA